MIQKPSIIITSLGRTATKFFQLLFADVVFDATSLHEPDYFNFGQYSGAGERVRHIRRQMRESGVQNLVIKKMLGMWSLIALSDGRVRGDLGYDEAVRRVRNQRASFVQSKSGSVYIESSSAYYGLIDVLKDVYERHRVAYIIRDGRDWVRSKMNFGNMYAKSGLRGVVSSTWPTALELEGDPYGAKWERMSRFERICWAWTRLNRYALETIEENPDARLFHFEDIFKSEDRYQHLADLMQFTTAMPNSSPIATGPVDGWLERKIHKSSGDFPGWEGWSTEHRWLFREICGPLMETLGYGID